MRFRIFDALTAGTQRWEEIDAAVPVAGGLFSATLGDGTPFGSLFAAYPNLWLEVAIDFDKNGSFAASEVYGPRQKMAGAAWAIEADRLDGQHGAFYQNASNINAGTLNNARFSAYSDLNAEGYLDNSAGTDLLTRAQGDGRYNSFKWVTVTTTAPVQASPNRGYMVNSPALVTITLPASPSPTPGDTIRVSGASAGGWKIAQNTGQRILARNLEIPNYSGTWTARESSRYWHSVASSADGTKLVACVYPGQIYTSSDSGVTWTARESNRLWWSVALSADGTKLVACVGGSLSTGQIYTYATNSYTLGDTTPGTAGYLTGTQGDAVELQYIGANTFVPLSHEGSLGAN